MIKTDLIILVLSNEITNNILIILNYLGSDTFAKQFSFKLIKKFKLLQMYTQDVIDLHYCTFRSRSPSETIVNTLFIDIYVR